MFGIFGLFKNIKGAKEHEKALKINKKVVKKKTKKKKV